MAGLAGSDLGRLLSRPDRPSCPGSRNHRGPHIPLPYTIGRELPAGRLKMMSEEEVETVARELAKVGSTSWYPSRPKGEVLRRVGDRYRDQVRAVIQAYRGVH